jgi:hypothetical protein
VTPHQTFEDDMAPLAMLFGALLIGLGLIGYFSPETFGRHDESKISPTALIPAGIGAVLLVCGLIVWAAPHVRKHVMHLAAAVGLIGFLGGFMPVMRANGDLGLASARSGIFMIVLCGLFVFACIASFLRSRVARSQGLPEPKG